MAKEVVLKFLEYCSLDEKTKDRLSDRNLSELIFHAKALNFQFTVEELTAVLGSMEWYIITVIDKEELNAYSSLWSRMWGKSRFKYIIEELFVPMGTEKWTKILSE
jgi:hypothetical protein